MKNLKTLLQSSKWFILIGIFIIFYCLIRTVFIKYNSIYDEATTNITGKIINYSFNGDKLSLTIKAKEKIIVNYYFKTEEEKITMMNNIYLGDEVVVSGRLKEPINNTIPNTFNYKKYLYNKKIYYTFSAEEVNIINNNKNIFYKIKDSIIKKINKMDNNDYYLTLLIGDKSLLSSEEINIFQNNGISHLFAISGMHIAVLVGTLSFFLKKFNEYIRLLLIIIFLIFLGFLTNYSASILRASIFFTLNSCNKIFHLNFKQIQILFTTGALILLLNPFMIYDIGFIYSFTITFGILYYQDKIKGNFFFKLLKTSIISFLFSLPITVMLNYEINLMSIIANIVFVPFVTYFLYPVALLSFIFTPLKGIFSISLQVLNILNKIFLSIGIVINIPKLSIILIIFYYLVLLLVRYKKHLLFILLFIVTFTKIIPILDNNYYVYFLDVGQGDSAVVISPRKESVIMIDTGGKVEYQKENWQTSNKNYNLSDNTIKFLKSLGITKLDYLILSHGDFDHMGESINIVNNIKVDKVIFNNDEYNTLEKELINVLDERKIEYYKGLNEVYLKELYLQFLDTTTYDNENDNSNVIYMNLSGIKLLFPGDASINKEKDLLEKYSLKDIDILKIGHHGSNTSSSKEFINTLMPKYSIISVGKNNRYGHPKAEVLETLSNSIIYRTDTSGSIMFKIKNGISKINTWSPYLIIKY